MGKLKEKDFEKARSCGLYSVKLEIYKADKQKILCKWVCNAAVSHLGLEPRFIADTTEKFEEADALTYEDASSILAMIIKIEPNLAHAEIMQAPKNKKLSPFSFSEIKKTENWL